MSDFNSLLSSLKNEIQSKFENINTRLNKIESNFESNITEDVNESTVSVPLYYYCINKMFQVRKLAENEKLFDRLDQHNRRNNLEIHSIPSTVGDEVLEDKVTEIFQCLNSPLAKSDIEDCHRMS